MATTLTVTADHDYSAETLNDIDAITFNTSGTVHATFAASQFDDVVISTSVQITGDANPNRIVVLMTSAGAFSAAGWSFSAWSPGDFLSINGSAGADTITGSSLSQLNSITGGGGADTLLGGSSVDVFNYGAGQLVAGETIDGGAGLNTITVAGGQALDFSVAAVSNIQRLVFSGAATVILAGDQIGASAITNVLGVVTKTLSVVGPIVDLSAVTFDNWTGADFIAIVGTAGADTLIGSNENDKIRGVVGADALNGGDGSDTLTGGRGKDILTGGANADIFDFNLKNETLKGANRDVVTDFSGVLGGDLDHIDLHGIDANTTRGGNQNFKFIGAHHFHNKAGELHFVKHGGAFVTVEGDINGDGRADFQIAVHNLTVDLNSLAKGDFIL